MRGIFPLSAAIRLSSKIVEERNAGDEVIILPERDCAKVFCDVRNSFPSGRVGGASVCLPDPFDGAVFVCEAKFSVIHGEDTFPFMGGYVIITSPPVSCGEFRFGSLGKCWSHLSGVF